VNKSVAFDGYRTGQLGRKGIDAVSRELTEKVLAYNLDRIIIFRKKTKGGIFAVSRFGLSAADIQRAFLQPNQGNHTEPPSHTHRAAHRFKPTEIKVKTPKYPDVDQISGQRHLPVSGKFIQSLSDIQNFDCMIVYPIPIQFNTQPWFYGTMQITISIDI